MTPEEAADHAEIAQTLQRYGQALDEKRYELLDQVFVDGAALHYELGDGGGPSRYPEMVKAFHAATRFGSVAGAMRMARSASKLARASANWTRSLRPRSWR